MTNEGAEDLEPKIAAVLARHGRQNGFGDGLATDVARLARRLGESVGRRGGRIEKADASGEPPEMAAAEVAAIVAEVLAGPEELERWRGAVKQLVKGCLQATRRECRDSYRETDGAGVCRRQVLAKARERVSGTHCVDCPYWLALAPAEHAAFLAEAWVGDCAEFAAEREIFLPEDFRGLRRLATASGFSSRP